MTEPAYQPHYRQIEQALRERIATLRPGERLPSDAELCAEFGVSRMTARNAMQRLAEDGLIAREPGRGSFVAEPPAHRRANRLMTFTQEMLRAGRVPSSRVLTRVIRPSSTAEAASLGIPSRQPVVHLRRLRLADGEPIALESAVLIGACANAVMTADLVNGSLHETLGRAGFVLRRGTGTISAAAATAEDARLLGDPHRRPAARRAAGHRRTGTAGGSRRPNRATRPTATGSSCSSRSRIRVSTRDGRTRRPTDERRRAERRSSGRLVLDDRVAPGRIDVEDGRIAAVELDEAPARPPTARTSRPASSTSTSTAGAATTRWAIGAALDGMARRLLRRGVTSFLPTAVTAPLDVLAGSPSASGPGCRTRRPTAPSHSGSTSRVRSWPPARRGAHDPAHLLVPADVPRADARAARRRPPADDHRPRAARRHRADRLAARPRRGRLARPLRRDRRGGPGGLRGRRDVHDPPVQRDDRHRPPRAGRGPRRAARRRRLRRADRRRPPRRPGPVAAHHPAQAARTGCCSSATRSPSRGRATGGAGSAASRSRSSAAASRWRDDDAGRLGHRPRQRGPQPRGRRASPLPAAVAAASRNPLALLGITDRGRIAVGQRADSSSSTPGSASAG